MSGQSVGPSIHCNKCTVQFSILSKMHVQNCPKRGALLVASWHEWQWCWLI